VAVSGSRLLHAAAATDPGRERANNEDRVLCEPELGIFAVIDGVGGESAGEIAAETALEVLRARLSRRTTDSARLVREAIALANRQIYERAQADPRLAGMSCVLTVAVLDGTKVTVGQVGDSRLYALAPGEIRKVTPDHSPVGAREDAGDLSESEAMRHPRRNEIFRDVGSGPHEPDDASWIDILEAPFAADGALLLCSDGLSDMVASREILDTVEANASSPPAAVHALIERANAAGGKDNVSAVLVEGDRFAEAVRRRRSGAGTRRVAAAAPATGGAGARSTRTEGRTGSAAGGMAPGRGTAVLAPGNTHAATAAASRGPAAASPRGAAWARPSWGERIKESLWGAFGKSLAAAVVLLALLAFYREPLLRWAGGLGRGGPARGGLSRGVLGDLPDVLVVGIGDGGFATIGEALARARPGQTIEVGPGRYPERLALRDGVALASRTPRGAVLVPPRGAQPGGAPAGEGRGAAPAVVAIGVRGARFAGFRIAGNAAAPWAAGVRLDGSEVTIEEVEVTGAAGAGIEVRGADRSTVRYCYVHHNAGPGVVVTGEAAPRLLSNLIAGNGTRPGAAAMGVEVRESALPLLADNRIEGNGGPGVSLPAPERAAEIFRWNDFGALPREQAVRVAASASALGTPGTSGSSSSSGSSGSSGGAGRSLAAHPAAGAGRATASPAAEPSAPRRHP
jgi:serine/threonine protein phosphatase PrpC